MDLAKFAGMNIFAAAFILSRVSPPEFLEMDPLARTEYLGPLIGYQRIVSQASPLSYYCLISNVSCTRNKSTKSYSFVPHNLTSNLRLETISTRHFIWVAMLQVLRLPMTMDCLTTLRFKRKTQLWNMVIRTSSLIYCNSACSMLYVTPDHENPTQMNI